MTAVEIQGLRQTLRAFSESQTELDVFLREGLLAISERVAADVRVAYAPFSAKGAHGVKAKVLRSGNAIVAQSLAKSRTMSRRRRNFGGLMMKDAFLPALERNVPYVERETLSLLDRLERNFDTAGV